MKKLRLRGDWSDTGPNSRPETEIRLAAGLCPLFILFPLCALLLVARVAIQL